MCQHYQYLVINGKREEGIVGVFGGDVVAVW